MIIPLLSLRTGAAAPFGPAGEPSAIHKLPVSAPLLLGENGLAGDAQADLKNHGGPDKALHHYPFDHYAAWLTELPECASLLRTPGAFGENLSTLGLTEATVCLGDTFRLGDALIQISQGRQPCWKLNQRFGRADMSKRVLANGRTGWYYRVLQAGQVSPLDGLELIDRPCPQWPVQRLFNALFGPAVDIPALNELKDHTLLASSWRIRAENRLNPSMA